MILFNSLFDHISYNKVQLILRGKFYLVLSHFAQENVHVKDCNQRHLHTSVVHSKKIYSQCFHSTIIYSLLYSYIMVIYIKRKLKLSFWYSQQVKNLSENE